MAPILGKLRHYEQGAIGVSWVEEHDLVCHHVVCFASVLQYEVTRILVTKRLSIIIILVTSIGCLSNLELLMEWVPL
jgi:hypothetical protein